MCMMKSGKNIVIYFENSLSTFREVMLRDLESFFCQWSKTESGKDIFSVLISSSLFVLLLHIYYRQLFIFYFFLINKLG